MSLDWRGDQVKAELRRAGRAGIDETMDLAVRHAQANHSGGGGRFESQSGDLVAGTKVVQPARDELGGRGARGRWGVTGPASAYAVRVEMGFQGKDALGRVYNAPPFPYLRPAAEATYPGMARRVRKAGRFA